MLIASLCNGGRRRCLRQILSVVKNTYLYIEINRNLTISVRMNYARCVKGARIHRCKTLVTLPYFEQIRSCDDNEQLFAKGVDSFRKFTPPYLNKKAKGGGSPFWKIRPPA